MSKLSTGAKLVLGGSVGFLIFSFLGWFSYGDLGSWTMWHGITGVLAGLLAVALVVWQGLRLANIEIALPISSTLLTAGLATLMLLFALLRFIDTPGPLDRGFAAWVGLAFAIATLAGAWLNMQAAGESLSDMKRAVTSGAAATAAAAKSASDSASSGSSSAAPTTPGAPSEPAQPAERTAENAVETAHDAGDRDDNAPAA